MFVFDAPCHWRYIATKSTRWCIFDWSRKAITRCSPNLRCINRSTRTTGFEFDIEHANRLLDELGLSERDDRGVRLLADGRPLEIVVQTAGESTEQTDVLELIHDSWLQAGIKLYSIPSTREVFRNRIFSGDAIMSIWSGLENGIPTAENSPMALAPTSKYQYQWPQWGAYYESSGTSGEEPELPAARELLALSNQWSQAVTHEERVQIWHKMLDINRDRDVYHRYRQSRAASGSGQ